MDLPLLLAGPILRRVEPTLVAVWVALRDPATVTLSLWQGRVAAGSGNVFLSSDPPGTKSIRVGKQLHIALAVIKIPKTSPRLLQPGQLYSYDLSIKTATETKTLKTLNLLTTGQLFGKQLEPLGFEENILPSFALPPNDITDLRVIFGSCRDVNNRHLDSMVWIDDLMRDNAAYSYTDAKKRPHQLFLGGDQIYADDVDPLHMRVLIDVGNTLIGTGANGAPLERVMVDNICKKTKDKPAGFADYGPNITRASSPATPNDFLLPADHACFPPGRRLLLSMVDAQMTSTDGDSHLLALGEFAAMYLSVWSDACWPRVPATGALNLPADKEVFNPPPGASAALWPDVMATYVGAPLDAKETRGAGDKLSPFQNYEAFRDKPPDDPDAKDNEKKFGEHLACVAKKLKNARDRLTTFESGLGKVRRVLANIPTYMMFDDHDVTDDWNLNPIWYDRVYTTSLGVTTVRNALVCYALFQDWGNDPLKYEKDDYKALLANIQKLFPADTPGPDLTAANNIDAQFGFNLRGVPDPVDGSVSAVNPVITWHFSVPGPQHLAVAIDNRTRRSFPSRLGPPGNVAGSLDRTAHTVQTEQIPAGPFTDGKKVLLVIAPLQVLGAPILDELVAPAAYRAFDAKDFSEKLQPGLRTGSRGMPGTNPDAIEAWAFDVKTLEALLRRLEPYRQVVLLSGDVHYSAGTVMSYWTKGNNAPARIVQFTSSGFKNVMPPYITTVDRSLSIAHQIVRSTIGSERLGWDVQPANPIVLPAGKTDKDVPRALRAKLRAEPTFLPTYGWPKGSVINPTQLPDWSWRVEPLFDVRANEGRPPAIQALPLDPTANATLDVPDAPHAIDGYQTAAARHQRAVLTLRNSRQILFRSNFGLVRFEQRPSSTPGTGPTVLHAIYEVYTAAKVPEDVGTAPLKPELFMLHVAALEAPQAIRPEQLSLQPVNADGPRVTTSVQV